MKSSVVLATSLVLTAIAGSALADPSVSKGNAAHCEILKPGLIKYLTADKSPKVELVGQGRGWSTEAPDNSHVWAVRASNRSAAFPGDVTLQTVTVTTPFALPQKVGLTLSASSTVKESVGGATVCEFFRKSTTKDWSQVKASDLVVGEVLEVASLLSTGEAQGKPVTVTPAGKAPAGTAANSRVFGIVSNSFDRNGFRVKLDLAAVK